VYLAQRHWKSKGFLALETLLRPFEQAVVEKRMPGAFSCGVTPRQL
jgi:hypothetical protein